MEGNGLFKKLKRPGFLQTRENRSLPPGYDVAVEEYSDEQLGITESYDSLKYDEAYSEAMDIDGSSQSRASRSQSVPEARDLPRIATSRLAPIKQGSANSISKSKDPTGLFAISLPRHPVVDVIFLHGLGGSCYRSWSWAHDRANFWPQWLVSEPEMRNVRVWTFGYAAALAGSSTTMNIMDFAKDLLFKMKYEQQDIPIGSLPLVFVTHSMGGLVAKKAFTIGLNDKAYTNIVSQLKAVIFMSTPHRGGNGAEALSQLLQVFGMSKDYVKELASNSTFLQSINDEFTNVSQDLQLFSFYETLKTSGVGGKSYIVDKDSGVLNLQNETSIPMVADHHTISPDYVETTNPSESVEVGKLLGIDATDLARNSQRFSTRFRDGTCHWIHHHQWFYNWVEKEESGPHLLWISGAPATGKSVLATYISSVVRRRWNDPSCHYHSFEFSDRSKRSASYLFRSLVFQMARWSPPLRIKLSQIAEHFGTNLEGISAAVLCERLFGNAMTDPLELHSNQFWIIDGLDESEPGAVQTIFQCFKALNQSLRFKILLLSRPTTDITMRIKQLPFKSTTHMLSTIDTYDDIKAYVEEVVAVMIPKGVATRQRLVDKVLTKASGNFLWVALATKDLGENWHLRSNIDTILSSFPTEMTPLYARMIQKIEKQAAPTRHMASTLLRWATYSFRPLHVSELTIALDSEFPDLTSLEDTISHICGDFVHVQNARINLVHETARHFLVNKNASQLVSLRSADCHEYLAILCLRYLSSTKDRQWRQILSTAEIRRGSISFPNAVANLLPSTYGFLVYASSYWAYHLSLAKPDSEALRNVVCEFFDNDVLTWINSLALMGDLKSIIKAAQYLKTFIKAREKSLHKADPRTFQSDDVEFLKLWTVDLIKLIGKFGSNLLPHPSSIYKLIPPFCPANSAIRKLLRTGHNGISVSGLTSADWDDCHARLSVGADESASKLIATNNVFAALVPQAQCLVVWSSETCEELRRLNHGEYVTEMAVSSSGQLVCTSGLNMIRIWELSTGRNVGSLTKHSDDRVLTIAFGSSEDEVLVGYQDHLIVCQNWRTQVITTAFRVVLMGDESGNQGLRCVSFNASGTQVAVSSRAKAVEVWDMPSRSRIHRCIRRDEMTHTEKDIFIQAEVIKWHPDSGNLYILYHDTILVNWNPVYDEQSEHLIGAKVMTLSRCGNYLLTSDHRGAVRIYTTPDHSRSGAPEFSVLYHLENQDFVSDLAFSFDSQRFYDLRGSVCGVWEPEVLVPAERPDAEEDSTSVSGSTWDGETIKLSTTSTSGPSITALSCAPRDLGFCCGRDDGSVAIHDMTTGKRLRTLPGHTAEMAIISLTWSSSGNYIASGDESGRVLVRKLALPSAPGGKLTVFKASEFRVKTDGINQLLFSSNDKYLLVSTFSAETVWDVSAKKICHTRKHSSPRHLKWIENPKNAAQLLSVQAGKLHVFDWVEFADLTPDTGLKLVDSTQAMSTKKHGLEQDLDDLALHNPYNQELNVVNHVTATKDTRAVIIETIPSSGHERDRRKKRRLELFHTKDLKLAMGSALSNPEILLDNTIQGLANEVSKLVGSYQSQVVFFDHQQWLCTWQIGTSVSGHQKHFFLPKEWATSEALSLVVLSELGTLLCPRNGEVAIITNGLKF
ncbi:WD40 repeat-like protein [Glarea lozoyensis ATCC 20868]|uniref:WD40 repeat-like protein n=1 Tax=Glarea lozoyensis (strain ATCC 20868 / MF5171) TaxID=1116229 RepID=S3CIL5_GLAL2|nr:WD40 repeat-like protein [Glarea lozoyensis ATCC 20868]EPE26317.1 WD40 repeat-like protein [Glarea lozoyensis ATCC 20868]